MCKNTPIFKKSLVNQDKNTPILLFLGLSWDLEFDQFSRDFWNADAPPLKTKVTHPGFERVITTDWFLAGLTELCCMSDHVIPRKGAKYVDLVKIACCLLLRSQKFIPLWWNIKKSDNTLHFFSYQLGDLWHTFYQGWMHKYLFYATHEVWVQHPCRFVHYSQNPKILDHVFPRQIIRQCDHTTRWTTVPLDWRPSTRRLVDSPQWL